MSEQEHKRGNDGAGEPVPGPTPQPWDPGHDAPGTPDSAGQEFNAPPFNAQPPGPQQPAPPPPGPQQPAANQPGMNQPGTNPWAQPQGNPWAQQPAAQGSAWDQPNPYLGSALPPHGYTPPPKPGIIPLRPLTLGEIMDGAFNACRRNPLATFGIAFVVQAVLTVLLIGLGAGLIPSLDRLMQSDDASGGEITGMIAGTASTLIGVSMASVLLVQGLLVLPVARATLNQKTRFGQVWRLAGKSILRLIGLALLLLAVAAVGITVLSLLGFLIVEFLGGAGLFVVVPAIFAVIAAGVWASVKISLAPAALVLEGIGIFRAVRRSWGLTGRNWWRTFGILILTTMIVNVLSQILTIPFSFLIGMTGALENPVIIGFGVAVLGAVTLLIGALAYAFQSAVTALLYIDLRIRREGFDLALMKDQEGTHSQDPDFLPGRNAVPMARNAPFGPPAGLQ